MSAEIKRYGIFIGPHGCPYLKHSDGGAAVLHTDHLASHAFDEAVERAAFEADQRRSGADISRGKLGGYRTPTLQFKWLGWKACAKSRAKRFGDDQ